MQIAQAHMLIEIRKAFVEVDRTNGFATNQLFFRMNRDRRTFVAADATARAEGIGAEVIALTGEQRNVGEDARETVSAPSSRSNDVSRACRLHPSPLRNVRAC